MGIPHYRLKNLYFNIVIINKAVVNRDFYMVLFKDFKTS